MRTCYLTCGFVNLLCSADACSPLIESWVAGVMVSAHSVAVLEAGARRASKSPKTISPCLDPAKRLEAYLAAEGVPLEAGASTASCPPSATAPSLSTKWEHSGTVGVFHLAVAPGDVVGQIRTFREVLWHWLGFEVVRGARDHP